MPPTVAAFGARMIAANLATSHSLRRHATMFVPCAVMLPLGRKSLQHNPSVLHLFPEAPKRHPRASGHFVLEKFTLREGRKV